MSFVRERPLAVLGGFVLLVALALLPYALLADGVTTWPDEMVYAKAAQHIWGTARPVFSGDPYFVSYSELLPLLAAPILGPLGVSEGLGILHALLGLALASTAIPVFLLGRRVGLDDTAALAAAALATITSGLSFAGTVMTETIAYPLFAWFLLAAQGALVRPSARNDVVALVALGVLVLARAQLVVLGGALVLAILLLAHTEGRSLRAALLRHRLLVGASVLGAVMVGGLLLAGTGGGGYTSVLGEIHLNTDVIRSGLDNLTFIVLATGAAPAALLFSWGGERLRKGDDAATATAAFAGLALCSMVVLVAQIAIFGAGFLSGTSTITGRYLLYLAIPFSLGTVAAVRRPPDLRALAWGGAIVLAIVVLTRASAVSSAIDAPSVADRNAIGSGVGGVLAPTALKFVLATMAVAAVAIAGFVLSRVPRRWRLAVMAVPLLLLGAGTAAYRSRSIVRQIDQRQVLSSPRTWIDDAVGAGAEVDVAPGALPGPVDEDLRWRESIFENGSVRRTLGTPAAKPLNALLFSDTAIVKPLDGTLTTLTGDALRPLLAIPAADVRFAPAGRVVSRHDGMILLRSDRPGKLRWVLDGIDGKGQALVRRRKGRDRAGGLSKAIKLYAYRGPGLQPARRAHIRVRAATSALCPCTARFGSRSIVLRAGTNGDLVRPLPSAQGNAATLPLIMSKRVRVVAVAVG